MKFTRLLVIIAVAYVFTCAALFFFQRTLLFPGASNEIVGRDAEAPWGEWISIDTTDGEHLAALYEPPAQGQPVILLFHGNADRIRGYFFLAGLAKEQGYGLLAPAFRGYPGSTGKPSEEGILEDGRSAWRWLRKQLPDAPIAIVGWSLGSGVAVNTASEHDPAAVVLLSSYDSIASVAAEKFPLLPVHWLIRDPLHSDQRIRKVSAPKLFMHGEFDPTIPMAHGKALFDLATEPKKFIEMKGEGHEIWTHEALENLFDFLNNSLRLSANE